MSLLNAIWELGPLRWRSRRVRSQRALLGVRVPNAMTMFASGRGQPIENEAAPR